MGISDLAQQIRDLQFVAEFILALSENLSSLIYPHFIEAAGDWVAQELEDWVKDKIECGEVDVLEAFVQFLHIHSLLV